MKKKGNMIRPPEKTTTNIKQKRKMPHTIDRLPYIQCVEVNEDKQQQQHKTLNKKKQLSMNSSFMLCVCLFVFFSFLFLLLLLPIRTSDSTTRQTVRFSSFRFFFHSFTRARFLFYFLLFCCCCLLQMRRLKHYKQFISRYRMLSSIWLGFCFCCCRFVSFRFFVVVFLL